ncbi:MAG: CvpA family protein [Planctomycetota bacterium]|jgi:membrane protein required for colicin V production
MQAQDLVNAPIEQNAVEGTALDSFLEIFGSLGWVDWTALAILVVFFILGLFKGLVWQASRVAILVLAYVFAGIYGEDLSALTGSWLSNDVAPELPLYLAYIMIFLSVLVTVTLIAYFLQKLVNATGLSFYNRVGGGFLGIATGGLVVLALLTAVHMIHSGLDRGANVAEAAESSHSSRIGQGVLRFMGQVLPEDWSELTERWQQLLSEEGDQPREAGLEDSKAVDPRGK